MQQNHRAYMKDPRYEKENLNNVLHSMAEVPMISDLHGKKSGSPVRPVYKNSEEELQRKKQKIEFLKYKAEQKGMLNRRENISKKIETMQREYNFIDKLTPDDVGYIMD